MTNSSLQNEEGFYFYSFPCLSGETKSLIVILHGHASHPDKYVKWANKTQAENPDADIILFRAPIAMKATPEEKAERNLAGADDLYTWFDIVKKRRKQLGLILSAAFNRVSLIKKLNKMVDSQLEKRGLDDKNLAFMGFSMGGAVAVQTAIHRRDQCAAVVCHSGTVLPLTRAKKKPETLMIMGGKDDIFLRQKEIAPSSRRSRVLKAFKRAGIKIDLHHDKAVKRLKKSGVPVTEKIFENQDHRITEESWYEASVFVADRLKPKH